MFDFLSFVACYEYLCMNFQSDANDEGIPVDKFGKIAEAKIWQRGIVQGGENDALNSPMESFRTSIESIDLQHV